MWNMFWANIYKPNQLGPYNIPKLVLYFILNEVRFDAFVKKIYKSSILIKHFEVIY